MLETLRNATRSWLVRGMLIVVASTFALYFGSGATMFSSLANRPVATVGNIKISQTDFAEAYRARFVELGGQLTPDQAKAFGLPVAVLSELVGAALIDNAARDLGIAVSDSALAADIRAQIGSLNSAMYQNLLRQQGLSVQKFEGNLRRDLVRAQLSAAVAPPPVVPKALYDALYRYREQKRVVEYVTIAAAPGDIPEPDAATLKVFYDANARRYAAPEFRDITYVALRPSDVIDSVRIREEDILAEYNSRKQEFTTPERRGVSQLFFATEADAQAARQRIDQGVAFAEAARPPAPAPVNDPLAPPRIEPRAPVADNTSLGVLRKDELPAEVAEQVFALPEGAVSTPLRTSFGWHLYRVDSVQRGGTKALDELRDQLRTELAQEQALTELFNLSRTLDDALAGGATLEEAAQKLRITAGHETIDAQGRNRAGERVETLPPFQSFLQTAFRTERGRESRLVDAPEGGYFVLRVDAVIAPAPIALDTIQERVKNDWLVDERNKRTEEAARAFLDKAKIAANLASYAEEARLPMQATPPFARSGRGLDMSQNLPAQLVGQMFNATVGEFAISPAAGGAYIVARLKEIVPVDPGEAQDAVDSIRRQVQQDMTNDILAAYQTALREAYGITVNERAFDQAMTVANQSLPTFPTRRQ